MRPRTFKASAIVLAALLVGACGGGGGGGGEGGAERSVLRMGTTAGIDSMNPFVGINEDGFSVWTHIYPTLLQYDTADPELPYIPGLAQEWELAEDGLSLTFTLREGAQWSDGTPLDAEAVRWSFDVFHRFNESAAAGWSIGSNITEISAPDARTLHLTFAEPSALSIYDMATTPILPRQVWEEHAGGDGSGLTAFDNLPPAGGQMVAGGPFILTEYRPAERAVFARNPNWYGTQPAIDGFGLETFRAADALVNALASGNLDAAYGVPPTALPTLEKADVTIHTGPALVLRDLLINSNPDKPEHRELLDPQVRLALELAIDRAEIVETAWVGMATPGDSVLPPATSTGGVSWYNEDLVTVGHDVAKANRVLDAAGYARGTDGVRLADGNRMEYEVVFADDESGPGDRAFQIIKENLAEVGITVTQRKLDSSATWDAIYCGADCAYRDFDLAMWNWHPGLDPNFLMASLTCDQWGSWNDVGYCDPEFDQMVRQQRMEVDVEARKEILDEMQQKIYDERPYIILTYDERIDVWSDDWEGFVPSPQGFFNNRSTQTLESVRRK